ncbi:MAG: metallophosphoesterase [Ruminococcus sp.]|nr:metallophosphoesterase [Ruminococcus sp.]
MTMIIFLILIIFCLLCIVIESKIIKIRYENIPVNNNSDNLKILHISDIHHRTFGKCNSRIVEKTKKISPDIIVITGDLISRNMKKYYNTGVFLKNLRKIAPVYLSLGNHELDLPPNLRNKLFKIINKSGVRILKNETVKIKKNNFTTYISGITLDIECYKSKDKKRKYKNLKQYTEKDLYNAIGNKKGYTILLAHNPLFFEEYAKWGADLVLSGHVHGGIIRLPIIGGILSPERKLLPKYSKGLYKKGNTIMNVSGGLGKLRLWNPPELIILILGLSAKLKPA